MKGVSLNARNRSRVVEWEYSSCIRTIRIHSTRRTVISYRLPEAGPVKLSIYDVTGKVIRCMNPRSEGHEPNESPKKRNKIRIRSHILSN
ncbi:MAG: hypothetical protein IPM86_02870 [Saprospiraceae bacterium]|nr:hypothetical protein [Saprospiraceae bacterium]